MSQQPNNTNTYPKLNTNQSASAAQYTDQLVDSPQYIRTHRKGSVFSMDSQGDTRMLNASPTHSSPVDTHMTGTSLQMDRLPNLDSATTQAPPTASAVHTTSPFTPMAPKSANDAGQKSALSASASASAGVATGLSSAGLKEPRRHSG